MATKSKLNAVIHVSLKEVKAIELCLELMFSEFSIGKEINNQLDSDELVLDKLAISINPRNFMRRPFPT